MKKTIKKRLQFTQIAADEGRVYALSTDGTIYINDRGCDNYWRRVHSETAVEIETEDAL
jgi:hypothetical protein